MCLHDSDLDVVKMFFSVFGQTTQKHVFLSVFGSTSLS